MVPMAGGRLRLRREWSLVAFMSLVFVWPGASSDYNQSRLGTVWAPVALRQPQSKHRNAVYCHFVLLGKKKIVMNSGR